MRRGQLARDLEAGVSPAHDEHRPVRNVAGIPVTGAVRLEHLRREPAGERRHVRHLKGPGGDDDLAGLEARALELDDIAPFFRRQRPHRAVELDRELEGGRVLLEVCDHLVARRIAVGVTGEGKAGQAVVSARREENERVPAAAPGGADRIGALEDHEPPTLARQEVTDRKASLARADYDEVEVCRRAIVPHFGAPPSSASGGSERRRRSRRR